MLGPTKEADAPPALVSEKSIVVSAGALTKPPEPSFTFTCPVSVWFVDSGFVAVSGVIWIFASTKVLTASSPFGATPSVSTVNPAEPATESVEVACAVTLPGVADVKVIVH